VLSYFRRGAGWMLTALAVALTGCGDDSTGPSGGGGGGGGGSPVMTTSVSVGNNFFSPEDILVSSGATVTWTWSPGGVVHNVTFASAAVTPSGNMSSGTFQAAMPAAAGTYTYQCTIHSGMTGSVQVQ